MPVRRRLFAESACLGRKVFQSCIADAILTRFVDRLGDILV